MLTTFQKIKETVLVTILNVMLPSVDIFTDLGSAIKLYMGIRTHSDCDESSELGPYGYDPWRLGPWPQPTNYTWWAIVKEKCIANSTAEGIYYISQPVWATGLLVPFLINYVTTWIVWWSVDKRKTVSWIAPLLSVYPQVRVV